jgi:hypothetical protein
MKRKKIKDGLAKVVKTFTLVHRNISELTAIDMLDLLKDKFKGVMIVEQG